MSSKKTKSERLEERNQRIRKRYHFHTSVKHLKDARALELLADEFLPLTEGTIWLILSQTGFYKNK